MDNVLSFEETKKLAQVLGIAVGRKGQKKLLAEIEKAMEEFNSSLPTNQEPMIKADRGVHPITGKAV